MPLPSFKSWTANSFCQFLPSMPSGCQMSATAIQEIFFSIPLSKSMFILVWDRMPNTSKCSLFSSPTRNVLVELSIICSSVLSTFILYFLIMTVHGICCAKDCSSYTWYTFNSDSCYCKVHTTNAELLNLTAIIWSREDSQWYCIRSDPPESLYWYICQSWSSVIWVITDVLAPIPMNFPLPKIFRQRFAPLLFSWIFLQFW